EPWRGQSTRLCPQRTSFQMSRHIFNSMLFTEKLQSKITLCTNLVSVISSTCAQRATSNANKGIAHRNIKAKPISYFHRVYLYSSAFTKGITCLTSPEVCSCWQFHVADSNRRINIDGISLGNFQVEQILDRLPKSLSSHASFT